MLEVTIYTGNSVIPAIGIQTVFDDVRLENLPEYFIPHLPVCVPPLIEPFLRNIVFFIGIARTATITTVCVEGTWRISKDRLPIVI
jgi:hypothetical protein